MSLTAESFQPGQIAIVLRDITVYSRIDNSENKEILVSECKTFLAGSLVVLIYGCETTFLRIMSEVCVKEIHELDQDRWYLLNSKDLLALR